MKNNNAIHTLFEVHSNSTRHRKTVHTTPIRDKAVRVSGSNRKQPLANLCSYRYPWGWLTGQPFPRPYLSSETRFFFESLFIIAGIEWYLYRQREMFGVKKSDQLSAVSSQQE